MPRKKNTEIAGEEAAEILLTEEVKASEADGIPAGDSSTAGNDTNAPKKKRAPRKKAAATEEATASSTDGIENTEKEASETPKKKRKSSPRKKKEPKAPLPEEGTQSETLPDLEQLKDDELQTAAEGMLSNERQSAEPQDNSSQTEPSASAEEPSSEQDSKIDDKGKNEQEEKADEHPLMNIEHFSDYRSKKELEQEAQALAILSEDSGSEAEPTDSIEEENDQIAENPEEEFENLTIFGENEYKTPAPAPKEKPKKAESPDEKKYDPENPRKVDAGFDFIELFVFTLVAIMLLTTFFFRHSVVEGGSMEQTLHDSEHLIITDLFYTPEPGDIIVFEDHSTGHKKPLVKRVIAVEGQTVKVDELGNVFIDGKLIYEEYIYVDYFKRIPPIECTVGEGEVFVMGDHRNASDDSRMFGTVREDSILGKVVLRFYPFDKFGTVD